jgi:hypothetical protein
LLTVQPAAGERVLLVTAAGGIGLSFSVLLLPRVIMQILRERDLTSRVLTARKHQAGIMGKHHGGSGSSGCWYRTGHGGAAEMTDYVISAMLFTFVVLVLVLLRRSERRRQ